MEATGGWRCGAGNNWRPLEVRVWGGDQGEATGGRGAGADTGFRKGGGPG